MDRDRRHSEDTIYIDSEKTSDTSSNPNNPKNPSHVVVVKELPPILFQILDFFDFFDFLGCLNPSAPFFDKQCQKYVFGDLRVFSKKTCKFVLPKMSTLWTTIVGTGPNRIGPLWHVTGTDLRMCCVLRCFSTLAIALKCA